MSDKPKIVLETIYPKERLAQNTKCCILIIYAFSVLKPATPLLRISLYISSFRKTPLTDCT